MLSMCELLYSGDLPEFGSFDLDFVGSSEEVESMEETSVSESLEGSTIYSFTESDSQAIREIAESTKQIYGAASFIFITILVYFAIRTIHNIFNKMRGIK